MKGIQRANNSFRVSSNLPSRDIPSKKDLLKVMIWERDRLEKEIFFRCIEDFFFILSTAEAFVRISGNINIMDINICSGYGLNNAEGHRQGLVVCLHGHCGGGTVTPWRRISTADVIQHRS